MVVGGATKWCDSLDVNLKERSCANIQTQHRNSRSRVSEDTEVKFRSFTVTQRISPLTEDPATKPPLHRLSCPIMFQYYLNSVLGCTFQRYRYNLLLYCVPYSLNQPLAAGDVRDSQPACGGSGTPGEPKPPSRQQPTPEGGKHLTGGQGVSLAAPMMGGGQSVWVFVMGWV